MGVKLSGMKLETMAPAIGKRFVGRSEPTRLGKSIHSKERKIGTCREKDFLYCFGADSLVNIWPGKACPVLVEVDSSLLSLAHGNRIPGAIASGRRDIHYC